MKFRHYVSVWSSRVQQYVPLWGWLVQYCVSMKLAACPVLTCQCDCHLSTNVSVWSFWFSCVFLHVSVWSLLVKGYVFFVTAPFAVSHGAVCVLAVLFTNKLLYFCLTLVCTGDYRTVGCCCFSPLFGLVCGSAQLAVTVQYLQSQKAQMSD